MKLQKNRKAFSMITAIVVIVLMSTVGAWVMSLSGKMVKGTIAQYQREQAMLLAKSYTEYAIMAVMSNNRETSGTCIQTITSNDVLGPIANGGYNITVTIGYISNANTDAVNDVNGCTAASIFSDAAVTPESSLNIIVDVVVLYRELDNPYNRTHRYHKRTLQKI